MLNKTNYYTKIVLSAIAIISLFLINFTWTFANQQFFDEKFPKLEAFSALAIEASTGRVLYYKNMEEKIYPASTTKILTAILAYENLDLDKKIVIPEDYKLPEGTKLNVKNKESLAVKDLIAGLLIVSGNDCAEILALEISGSLEEFSVLMNKKASELGCVNTSFKNPSGLPNEQHYTTALDMSKIANYFIDIPYLYELSNQKTYRVPSTNLSPERILTNTNRFFSNENISIDNKAYILNQQGVEGIKTGYTGDAGRCLISSFNFQGQKVITLVYNSSLLGVYRDTIEIKNYIESTYNPFTVPIVIKDQVFERKYFLSPNNLYTDILFGESFTPLVSNENGISFKIEPIYYELNLPIKKGEIIGEAQIIDPTNNLLSSVYLVSNEDINVPGASFKILVFLIILGSVFVTYKSIKKQ